MGKAQKLDKSRSVSRLGASDVVGVPSECDKASRGHGMGAKLRLLLAFVGGLDLRNVETAFELRRGSASVGRKRGVIEGATAEELQHVQLGT